VDKGVRTEWEGSLDEPESKIGLRLALHLSDNNVDATVTYMTSGFGITIWDDERDVISAMTMSANKPQMDRWEFLNTII